MEIRFPARAKFADTFLPCQEFLQAELAQQVRPEAITHQLTRLDSLVTRLQQGDCSVNHGDRAIEILEHIGTSTPGADATQLAAMDLLKKLAGGAPEARLTEEAKASLQRLAKRRSR